MLRNLVLDAPRLAIKVRVHRAGDDAVMRLPGAVEPSEVAAIQREQGPLLRVGVREDLGVRDALVRLSGFQ